MATVCIMNEISKYTHKKNGNNELRFYNLQKKWNENAIRFHHIKCCRDHMGIFSRYHKVEKFIGRMQKC